MSTPRTLGVHASTDDSDHAGVSVATFHHTRVGQVAFLAVAGHVGTLGALQLRRELRELLARDERHFVIDLSAAVFEGPSGPAVVILALRVMRAHRRTLTLAEFADSEERPFLAALRTVFEFYDVQAEVAAPPAVGQSESA